MISSVSFSPNGKQVISGCGDGTVKIWDMETGKEIRTLKGHNYCVYSVCFSPNGKQVVLGGWDETIELWDVETGKEIKTFEPTNDDDTGIIWVFKRNSNIFSYRLSQIFTEK